MNQEIPSVGIYPKNYLFESDHLPLISFKTEAQKTRAEEYILKKVNIFFSRIIKINIDVKKSQISYSNMITEKDFDFQVKKDFMEYFYKNIFVKLGKRKSNGQLYFSPKWGITFDEKCAPILISYLRDPNYYKTSNGDPKCSPLKVKDNNYDYTFYRYGTIDINKKPVFYYIYFTLQEILDVVKLP